MKRSKAFVPAAETGQASGDGSGQGIGWVNKGGRNATTEQSRRGAGQLAPKPSGGAALPGNDRPSHPVTNSMARVQNRPSSPARGTSGMSNAGSFTPVQNNAMANLTGQATGQAEVLPRGSSARISPQTRTSPVNHPVATQKPGRRKTPAPFYGEF